MNRANAPTSALLGVLAFAGLLGAWVFASGIGEDDAIRGTGTAFIWAPVGLGSLALLTAGGLWQVGRTGAARTVQVVGAVALLVPSGLVVVVTETVQAWLPGWLAPVLTNSDVFAFRAGIGAWVALVAGLAGIVLAAVGAPRLGAVTESGGAAGYLAIVSTLVGATGLMVLRARPFTTVDLSVADVGDEVTQVITDAAGEDLAGLGGAIAGGIGGETTINLVAGDIPIFGQVSLLATIALVVALLVMLARQSLAGLIVAGASAGTLMFVGWLLAAVVVTIDVVIPDSWLSIDGYAAVAARPTSSLWWHTLWSALFTVGAASVAMSMSQSGRSHAAEPDPLPVTERLYEWGPG